MVAIVAMVAMVAMVATEMQGNHRNQHNLPPVFWGVMMITEAIRQVDLLALIGRDVQLRRVASTNGGEWAGPCPFCGGHDRFRVWP